MNPASPATLWSARRGSVSPAWKTGWYRPLSEFFFLNSHFVFHVPDPPSAPQWLEVTNITKVNADLKWQAPSSDGGSPITNYVVEKRDVRRKAWQSVDTTVKELKYTVTPLNEGSLYVFRVAAENAIGMGEFCELEDAVLAKDTFSEFTGINRFFSFIFLL